MATVYPNLAGFVTDYKDGGLAAPPPPATTDVVLVVGTAADGPTDRPVVVTIPQGSVEFFGDAVANAQANLVRGLGDAYDAGARGVNAMRIGGDYAALILKEDPAPGTGNPRIAYAEIDPLAEFDIPDPQFLVGDITMSDPVNADEIRFARAGFSSNMAGGMVYMKYTLDGGVTYTSVEKAVSSVLDLNGNIAEDLVIDLSVDLDIDGNPLPRAQVGYVDLLGVPDDVSGQFVRYNLGEKAPVTNYSGIVAYAPPGGSKTGAYANTAYSVPVGKIDCGANFGNMTLKMVGPDFKYDPAGPVTTYTMNAAAGRKATKAELEFDYDVRFWLAGTGAVANFDNAALADEIRITPSGTGANPVPGGAHVAIGVDLMTPTPTFMAIKQMPAVGANPQVMFPNAHNDWNNLHHETTVDVAANIGDTIIGVASTTKFVAGQTVTFDAGGANEETAVIDSVVAGVSITLVTGLTNAQGMGNAVTGGAYGRFEEAWAGYCGSAIAKDRITPAGDSYSSNPSHFEFPSAAAEAVGGFNPDGIATEADVLTAGNNTNGFLLFRVIGGSLGGCVLTLTDSGPVYTFTEGVEWIIGATTIDTANSILTAINLSVAPFTASIEPGPVGTVIRLTADSPGASAATFEISDTGAGNGLMPYNCTLAGFNPLTFETNRPILTVSWTDGFGPQSLPIVGGHSGSQESYAHWAWAPGATVAEVLDSLSVFLNSATSVWDADSGPGAGYMTVSPRVAGGMEGAAGNTLDCVTNFAGGSSPNAILGYAPTDMGAPLWVHPYSAGGSGHYVGLTATNMMYSDGLDRVPWSNTNTGNKDIGGITPGSEFGNVALRIKSDDYNLGGAFVQFTRVVTPPTTGEVHTFSYSAADNKFYLSDFFDGVATSGNFDVEVGATMYDDVTGMLADVDVVVAPEDGGFVYEAIPDPITGLVTHGGDIYIAAGITPFLNQTETKVSATLYEDGSIGGSTYADAIALAELFARPAGEWYMPYISSSAITISRIGGGTVNVSVVDGNTALAKVRIEETEVDADIPAGIYTYPFASGKGIGSFGRSIIIDTDLAAGEAIRVPYIKAVDSGTEAILIKRNSPGGKPVVGSVFLPEHEDAGFTVATGSVLAAGEYWYYTDVAVYIRAVYPGARYGNDTWVASLPTNQIVGVSLVVDNSGILVPEQKTIRVQKPLGKGSPDKFDVPTGTILTNPSSQTSITYKSVVVGLNTNRENNVMQAQFVADFEHPVAIGVAQYEREHRLLDPTGTHAPAYLRGGDDGVGKDPGYYLTRLLGTQYDTGLLQLIENTPVDIIALLDMYLDAKSRTKYFGDRYGKLWYNKERGIVIVNPDGTPKTADANDVNGNNTITNFGQVLAEHCYQCSLNGNERLGIVSVAPATDISLRGIQSRVLNLTKTIGDGVTPMYAGFKTSNPLDGRMEDVGRYLSVCCGPEVVSQSTGRAVTTEAMYAGRISTLSPEAAPTHKPMLNLGAVGYNYSNAQLDALTGMRYVTLYSYGGVVYVTDGITAAGDLPSRPGVKSDYTRLSTVRVVHSAMAAIRRVAGPFLGQPNSIPQRLALNTAVDEVLRTMVNVGALSDYAFTIISTRQMAIIGELRIELTLNVWLELRKIRTVVSLALPNA